MKKRTTVVLAGALIAGVGTAAFATLAIPTQEAAAVSDPRQEPPIVRLATAARVTGSERGFTGIVGARVLSNLGFRVPGKIVERLVNAGQQVGTVLILLFLPALYVAWFRIKPTADEIHEVSMEEPELRCRATVLPQLGLHPPLWRFIA